MAVIDLWMHGEFNDWRWPMTVTIDVMTVAKAEIGVAIARVIELPASGLQEAALRYLWRARELMDEIANVQASKEQSNALG